MAHSRPIQDTRKRREKHAETPSGTVRRGRKSLFALVATAALGAGLLSGGTPALAAENPLGGLGLDDITGLLENEMLKDYLALCDSPDGSTAIPDEDSRPSAVVDCGKSTGTGIAVVLPGAIEVGTAAEGMTVDIPLFGNKNLIEIVSAAAIDPWFGAINPLTLGRYKTYEQVQRDAALPVDIQDQRYCSGVVLFGNCIGGWKNRTVDVNLAKRTEALKVAEYLTGGKYDYTKPLELPGKPDPVGSSTVVGPGMQLALSMTGGTARAETGHEYAIATAGAGDGRTSNAYAYLGMANALNLDTDQIKLTWFGQEIDFTNLKKSGLLGIAGDEAEDMVGTIEDLQIPALKEVSCYGVLAQATAEGLGSCSNILGTFDMYKDERAPKAGESRQTQYGLTDITSLVLGNDALLKQINGTSESTPFMDTLMDNLTSEEGRLKFAKDFVRFTQDVKTVAVEQPAFDEDGNPILDEEGQPVMEAVLDEDGNPVTQTITAAYLTSDYGFRNPITIEWLGHRVVLFPAVTVNGEERPNYLGLPQIEKIVADAETGELPKVSLVPKVSLIQWDNAFGLGTLTLDKPLDPVHTLKNYFDTVTIVDDIKGVGELVGGSTGPTGSTGSTGQDETEQPGDEAEQPDENADGATGTTTDSTGKPQDDAAKSPANTPRPDASTTTPVPTTPVTTTPSAPDTTGTSGAQSDDDDEQEESADAA